MKRPLSRNSMILITSVLLAAGFTAVSLSSYAVSQSAIRSSIINEELPTTSDTIYSEIQRDLIRPVFISSMMAHDTFLRDWVIAGENNSASITKYLNEIRLKYGTVTSFFVSDHSGSYYQAQGILKKVSKGEPRDAWYYRVKDMKEPYEINVDPDLSNRDAMTIFINYKVEDYHGRFIGAAGVGLTVEAVKKIIAAYQAKFGRSVYFIDKNGTVMLSGSSSVIPGTNIRKIRGLSSFAPSILQKTEGTYEYRDGLAGHFINARYLPEMKWYLFVEKTDSEALAGIRSTLALNLLISILISAVIIILTAEIMRHFQSRLEAMAATDMLTGLFNRRVYSVMIEQAMKDAARTGSKLTAAVLDIDHFKMINDTYGHLAGDRVLRHAADCIRSQLRQSDAVCRWGGEEFSILFKQCGEDEAFAKTDLIRKTLQGSSVEIGGSPVSVTFSFGVAQYRGGESAEELLERADQTMYRAKASGRNRGCREEEPESAPAAQI